MGTGMGKRKRMREGRGMGMTFYYASSPLPYVLKWLAVQGRVNGTRWGHRRSLIRQTMMRAERGSPQIARGKGTGKGRGTSLFLSFSAHFLMGYAAGMILQP